MSIRVVLADDHEVVREGFRALLDREPDIDVVAEAPDGMVALQQVEKENPDVVVIDIAMPVLNGVEATRHIADKYPHIKVVALSIHSESRYITEMLRAGASGYLLKNCAFQELIHAIRTVADAQNYLSPAVAGTLVNTHVRSSPEENRTSKLSAREKEVLQLLSEGRISKEIASTLHLSVRTVDVHRKNIMDKLGLRSIAELTRFAIQEGITFLNS